MSDKPESEIWTDEDLKVALKLLQAFWPTCDADHTSAQSLEKAAREMIEVAKRLRPYEPEPQAVWAG